MDNDIGWIEGAFANGCGVKLTAQIFYQILTLIHPLQLF